jgi:hypothetical protein
MESSKQNLSKAQKIGLVALITVLGGLAVTVLVFALGLPSILLEIAGAIASLAIGTALAELFGWNKAHHKKTDSSQ